MQKFLVTQKTQKTQVTYVAMGYLLPELKFASKLVCHYGQSMSNLCPLELGRMGGYKPVSIIESKGFIQTLPYQTTKLSCLLGRIAQKKINM